MKGDLMNTSTPADGDGTDLDALLKGLMDGADLDNVDLDALLEGLADGDTDTGDAPQA